MAFSISENPSNPVPWLIPDLQYKVAEELLSQLRPSHESDERNPLVYSTLLVLRLTCLNLAKCQKIKAVLFEEVRFQATVENLARLRQTDWVSLAPFIKKVSFAPSLHTTKLSFDVFRLLVRNLNHRSCDSVWPGFDDSHCFDNPELRRYSEVHWDGGFPHAEPEFRTAFALYNAQAHIDEVPLKDGSMLDSWTETLRILHKTTSFNISSVLGRHPFETALCEYGKRDEDECWDTGVACLKSRSRLRNAFSASHKQLCTLAASCLYSADAQIVCLTIDSELAQSLSEDSSPMLNTINLRGLKVLTFDTTERLGNTLRDEREMMTQSLNEFLSQCHTGLEELSAFQNGPSHLPYNISLHLGFPCLRRLRLEGLQLPVWFGAQLISLPALKNLCLAQCYSLMGRCQNDEWRLLFFAIRQHPNSVHLTFDRVYTGECGVDTSFVFDPAKAVEDMGRGIITDPRDEVQALYEFMTVVRPWDEFLQESWRRCHD